MPNSAAASSYKNLRKSKLLHELKWLSQNSTPSSKSSDLSLLMNIRGGNLGYLDDEAENEESNLEDKAENEVKNEEEESYIVGT